jgi:hypothetical protein
VKPTPNYLVSAPIAERPPKAKIGERWETFYDGIGEVITHIDGRYRLRMDKGGNLTFTASGLKHKVDVPDLTDAQLLEAIQKRIDKAQDEADKWKRVRKAWIGV